ncbi:hypothetical protein, partial [Bilophila wadsworthia]|uniref:hypothetical protein n=1 Tax=Bilophila wadsworthia TaxID=35833 RepID=UPI001EDADA70
YPGETFLEKGSPSPLQTSSLPLPRLLYGSTKDGQAAPSRFGGVRLPETQQKIKGPHRDAGLFHKQNRSVSPKANPLKGHCFQKAKNANVFPFFHASAHRENGPTGIR